MARVAWLLREPGPRWDAERLPTMKSNGAGLDAWLCAAVDSLAWSGSLSDLGRLLTFAARVRLHGTPPVVELTHLSQFPMEPQVRCERRRVAFG